MHVANTLSIGAYRLVALVLLKVPTILMHLLKHMTYHVERLTICLSIAKVAAAHHTRMSGYDEASFTFFLASFTFIL